MVGRAERGPPYDLELVHRMSLAPALGRLPALLLCGDVFLAWQHRGDASQDVAGMLLLGACRDHGWQGCGAKIDLEQRMGDADDVVLTKD